MIHSSIISDTKNIVHVIGVYLPQTSGMMKLDGLDGGVIITTVNSHPVPDMKTFISVMQSIPDREMIPIEFYSIADVHSTSVTICTMDKHWSSFKSAKRNGKIKQLVHYLRS